MSEIEAFARKAGLGFGPSEIVPTDPESWIDEQLIVPRRFVGIASLKQPDTVSDWPTQLIRKIEDRYDLAERSFEEEKRLNADRTLSAEENRLMFRSWVRDNFPDRHDETRLLHRAIYAPDQLRQRLLHFWANHFYVSPAGEGSLFIGDHLERAIEANLDGSFEELLFAATTSPAMLFYLDNHINYGPNSKEAKRKKERGIQVGSNDNLARELLELHTVTPDLQYTENQIREVARVLSGWGPPLGGDLKSVSDLRHPHNPNNGERGKIDVFGMALGSQFGGNAKALRPLLNFLATHELTVSHLCDKLCRHFIADNPDPEHIEAVKASWVESRGHLPTIHRELLRRTLMSVGREKKFLWPMTWLMQSARISGSSIVVGWDDLKNTERNFLSDPEHIANEIGQGLFLVQRQPDGYAIDSQVWKSPAHMERRLKFASLIGLHGKPKIDPANFMVRLNFKSEIRDFVKSLDNSQKWAGLLCNSEFLEV